MRESYIIQNYKGYLKQQNLSPTTVDNYLVDCVLFLKWLSKYLRNQGFNIINNKPSTSIGFINKKVVNDYKSSLLKAKIPAATLNRRLAGLKKLLNYIVERGYLISNPAQDLAQIKNTDKNKILESFRLALIKSKVTDTTVKNYISDIRDFLNLTDGEFTGAKFQLYLEEIDKKYTDSSRKRKISALRKFILFLSKQGYIDGPTETSLREILSSPRPNPAAAEIIKPPKRKDHHVMLAVGGLIVVINLIVLTSFNQKVLKEIADFSTQPRAMTLGAKTSISLPIKAKLTDSFGIPLSYEQDINFSIYPTENSSEPIYTTGRCAVTPDEEGNLDLTIGEKCGAPIDYSLFLENPELYLGVTIGFGKELEPRSKIKGLEVNILKPTPTPVPLPTLTRDRLFLPE
jgi:site-specific recombinase XerD